MTREESGRPKALLEVENVTIAAGGQTLLRNVTLMLDAGEIVAVQGPSGCGKTTLLRVIAGLTDPSEGVIRFDGQLREEMTWPLYRRRFPLMEQQSIMIGGTVRDNLKGPFRYASANGAAYDEKTARALFQRLCLEEAVLDQPGSQLSVGQRQRVALVRALLLAPGRHAGRTHQRARSRLRRADGVAPKRIRRRTRAGRAGREPSGGARD
ncbi:MAG: ATP-binding cassette domain-containing protein [Candidatus Hydrogenedentota bacterium]